MTLKGPVSENDRAFTCCFCCHVRVGTAILGILHVLLNLLALGLASVSLLSTSGNSDVLKDDLQTGITFTVDTNDSSTQYYYMNDLNSRDSCLMFALIMCTFLIALMMVYGSIRGRPGYLIPFFCLQVFDFCIHCLSVVGYMTYVPNIKQWFQDNDIADAPGVDRLMQMDEQWLQIWFVIIIVLILSVKAYLINMVWMCYRYLQIRILNRSVVREYTVDPDSEMLLPPKYEEAMKMQPTGVAPPPYSA